ncbi:MAG: PSD1 and planctomycete cytochrome C domain-containing protein [Planctomycetaceae bacterium]
MSRLSATFSVLVVALAAIVLGPVAARSAEPEAKQFSHEQIEFFEAKVRPLLAGKCFRCHGPEKQKGGLRLDSRASALRGGDTGAVIEPGKPSESPLVEAINYQGLEMPPDAKLKDAEIAILTTWVSAGAPWPDDKPSRIAEADSFEITAEDRNYWAFQPVRRPPVPTVRQTEWVNEPIDAFVLSQLEAKGLQPNGAADRRTLIRRLFLDLIGLPPTPQEVDAFVADDSPAAYEKLVDDLLSRQQYGERWGRYWLDVVRFAQTNGYERDDEKINAWRYRDYVIRALNEDKPYDRFVLEQLAGDELDDVTHDSIIATGFYRLGVWDDEPDDMRQAEFDEYDEIIRTTSSAFLGLTLGCARCHNHMFDPISQEDYYRFLAHFRPIELYGKPKSETHYEFNERGVLTPLTTPAELATWKETEQRVRSEMARFAQQLEALRRPVRERLFSEKLAVLPEELRKSYSSLTAGRSAEQQQQAESALRQATPTDKEVDENLDKAATETRRKLQTDIKERSSALEKLPFEQALSVRETGSAPRETHLLVRGNTATPSKKVEPGLPQIFGGQSPVAAAVPPRAERSELHRVLSELGVKPTNGLRRGLAAWIASPENPLTARVIVNRLWQHHFGRGIVPTPDNFGRAGLPPTNSELLDWLAAELVAGGWRLKPLHKRIVMSSAYRMSSRADNAGAVAVDPGNDLHWRQNMRRLDAEAIRDSVLTVSGQLNFEMGGRGIFPTLSGDVLATQSRPGKGWEESDERAQSRRSAYIYVKRTLMVPLLETFDYTNTSESLGARPITTVAPQALMLLNSEFLSGQAAHMADRIVRQVGDDPKLQTEHAFRLALLRSPTRAERETAENFLTSQRQRFGDFFSRPDQGTGAAQKALCSLCLTLMNLNEFVYVD